MSKRSEEAALKAYPHFTAENITEVTNARHIFAKGYEQAEKDLGHHSEKGKIGKSIITQEDVEGTLLSLGIQGIDDMRLSDLVDLALIYYNKGATSSVGTKSKG